jgi:hypothetical protein
MKKISDQISFCRPGSCCEKFSIIEKGGREFLEIIDDFGEKVLITSDEKGIIDVIKRVYESVKR